MREHLELVYETVCHQELPQDALTILEPAINDEPANTRKFVSKNNLWHKINLALANQFEAAVFSLNFCVIKAAEEEKQVVGAFLPFLNECATVALKMLLIGSYTIKIARNDQVTVNYFVDFSLLKYMPIELFQNLICFL